MQVPPLAQGPPTQSLMSAENRRGDILASLTAKTGGGGKGQQRTFVTVDPTEAWLTHAAEVAAGLADAAPPQAADVRGDAAHAGRVVGRHGNRAAVDGCGTTEGSFHWWGRQAW